uniref:Evx1 protein n=1 Tax=Mus musculus TaxID=10090 RepID=A0JNS7_MOUSE|nr:Evx1 protein [Mus musculus]
MESRKDMVMFLDGGQLGTLVGKRVSNLSEAVSSPLPEPPEKMVPHGCLSPRAGPPTSRERGGGGQEEEPVDGLAGSAAGLGAEPRSAGAAMLGPGPPVPSADSLSGQGQPSSSDTESDFYEEIEVSCTPDCATGNAEYQHSKAPGSDALGSSPTSGSEAPKSNGGSGGSGSQGTLAPRAAAAAAASDFTCASTSRSDSFLTFAPSVLSKASSVAALDQREEVPLTR